MHAQDADDERCATTRAQLGAFIRNDVSKREGAAVEAHLRDCRECAAIYLELVEVNSGLRALIAPIFLGGAAAAYLGGAAAGGAGALACWPGSAGSSARAWGRTLAGVTAACVVVAGVVAGVHGGGDDRRVAATERAAPADPVAAPQPKKDRAKPPKTASQARPSDAPAGDTSDSDPQPEPTTSPTERPQEPRDPEQPEQPEQPSEPDEPTDDPTTDPPATTSAVSSSASPMGGLVWDVSIRVTGLAATEAGTVTVTMDRPAVGVHLDPRCDLVNLGRLTCRPAGTRHDPAAGDSGARRPDHAHRRPAIPATVVAASGSADRAGLAVPPPCPRCKMEP